MNHWLRPGFGQPWSFKTQCLAITFSRKSSQISLQTGSFNILLTRSPPSFCILPYMGKASLEPHPLDLCQRGWGLLLPRRDAGLLRRRLRRSSSPRSQQRLPGSGRQPDAGCCHWLPSSCPPENHPLKHYFLKYPESFLSSFPNLETPRRSEVLGSDSLWGPLFIIAQVSNPAIESTDWTKQKPWQFFQLPRESKGSFH